MNTARFQIIDVDDVTFPELQIAHRYWIEKKPNNIFAPSWKNIELLDLPSSMLPRVCVVDVNQADNDFTYRFWGTAITDMHHYDLTGKSVRTLTPPDYAACIHQQYEAVVTARHPVAFVTQVPLDVLRTTYYVAIRFPLSNDGTAVDHVLSAEHYGEQKKDLADLFDRVYRSPSND